jgi:hypothetical protein
MERSRQLVEEIITGQKTLINYPKTIRTSARRYARRIIREQAPVNSEGKMAKYTPMPIRYFLI